MSRVSQKAENDKKIFDRVNRFLKQFRVGKILFQCNAGKEKGVPVMQIFRYLLCLVFSDRTMFMQMKTGTYSETFSKNTVYRFLNNLKTNWQRFTVLLSAAIITGFMKPLTSDDRKDVLIVDDSLYSRARSRKSEMLARVFDHCTGKFTLGYRLLTLGWSDGNSYVPVNFCLLSAAEDKNLMYEGKHRDGRTLSERRKSQARRKGTDVMVELVKMARKAGITAKYVLFDSWFSSPKTITAMKKDCGLDTIAILKKGNTKFQYNGNNCTVKEIYSQNRKRRGRSKYLLSVIVSFAKDGETMDARLVYVRNKSKRKDWLVLLCTDMELPENEVIRIYGKRWDIEVFFKTCKSYLNLLNECHSNSFDALYAHTAIVFTRYMLLSISQRENCDDRTLSEVWYMVSDELKDITFTKALQTLWDIMLHLVKDYFHITDDEISALVIVFLQGVPAYMRNILYNPAA